MTKHVNVHLSLYLVYTLDVSKFNNIPAHPPVRPLPA